MSETATMLIDGRRDSRDATFEVTASGDGSHVGTVAQGCAADTEWSETLPRKRADIVLDAARLISDRKDEPGRLPAREAGKRLPKAVGELGFSAQYFRWFAEEARRPHGQVQQHEAADRRHLTVHRPSGVVASLRPWNFPCSTRARKLAPALAAGCTVVARVSEKAPLAATEMIRCLTDEPGGDAPFIVFEDADVDAALEGAMLAKSRNTGQSCIAANRFLVHEDVYDAFTERLAKQIDALTIGDGLADPCPDLGPVIDAERAAEVGALRDEALAAGARRLTRGAPPPGIGSYMAPTLLADVPDTTRLAREEVFGPLAGVFPFRTVGEAPARANSMETGLAGYFCSLDLERSWRIAERGDRHRFGINNPSPSVAFAPMGGVKQSGLGREGARSGLEEVQDARYLALGL